MRLFVAALAITFVAGCGHGGAEPSAGEEQYNIYVVTFPPGITTTESAWLLETLDESERVVVARGWSPRPTHVWWVWNRADAARISSAWPNVVSLREGFVDPVKSRVAVVYDWPGVTDPRGGLATCLAVAWGFPTQRGFLSAITADAAIVEQVLAASR